MGTEDAQRANKYGQLQLGESFIQNFETTGYSSTANLTSPCHSVCLL